jgi:hypothetical protein
MVKGIYQTSNASARQSNMVAVTMTLAFLLALVAGVCSTVINLGGKVCTMAYYTPDVDTYKGHAEKSMSKVGYRFSKMKDMGDYPKSSANENPKIRRFRVKGLVSPTGGFIGDATVDIKFDSWTYPWASTTIKMIWPDKTGRGPS